MKNNSVSWKKLCALARKGKISKEVLEEIKPQNGDDVVITRAQVKRMKVKLSVHGAVYIRRINRNPKNIEFVDLKYVTVAARRPFDKKKGGHK